MNCLLSLTKVVFLFSLWLVTILINALSMQCKNLIVIFVISIEAMLVQQIKVPDIMVVVFTLRRWSDNNEEFFDINLILEHLTFDFFIQIPMSSTQTIKQLFSICCRVAHCIRMLHTCTINRLCKVYPKQPLEGNDTWLIDSFIHLSFDTCPWELQFCLLFVQALPFRVAMHLRFDSCSQGP